MFNLNLKCGLCGSGRMKIFKKSSTIKALSSADFAISDSRYGITNDIFLCEECGFIQCGEIQDLNRFYADLRDPEYEAGRKERALQARKLLTQIQTFCPRGRLLDIGAGSGIFIEQAIAMGYQAEGLEPSKWLHERAQKYGLPVRLGSFPGLVPTGRYEVVTLIDVIEHVPNPLTFLSRICNIISENGIVVVVTPDVGSLVARILGRKWWHFRIAHIGYFNRKTLGIAMDKAGFRLLTMKRPTWYFTGDYLFERFLKYLPQTLRIRTPSFIGKIVIPLNLRDSLLGIYAMKRR